jgi:glycosyltransferase involved in cell wall biosynthesis
VASIAQPTSDSPHSANVASGSPGGSQRIVYLTAGAASRFCGSCLHDNGLARALIARGEDVLLVPTFTPLRTDEENVSIDRIFFGGVNVFLQQHSALFRHTPWFIDRLLDSPRLLNWLSSKSAGMEAADLGGLTVSTLQGEHGLQRKEMEKLLEWLEAEAKPSIVHLSNALLLGMARPLRKRLGVPIVSGLAGEDWFVEQLKAPHYSQVRELLQQQANEVDAFVAYNNYFADFMAEYMSIPRGKIEVIPHGIDLNGYPTARRAPANAEFTIGYFGRVAVEKGLHLLVDAFGQLCRDESLPPVRLKIGGYKSSGDEPYYQTLVQQATDLGIADRFEYVGELNRSQKIDFLQSLDVMAVATVYQESKGLSVLESLANGVPVVAPRHGSFPEMLEQTGGGLLFEPNNPTELARTLAELIRSPQLIAALGENGLAGIQTFYTAEKMAIAHRNLYSRVRQSVISGR